MDGENRHGGSAGRQVRVTHASGRLTSHEICVSAFPLSAATAQSTRREPRTRPSAYPLCIVDGRHVVIRLKLATHARGRRASNGEITEKNQISEKKIKHARARAMNQHPCGKPGGAATAASSPSLKQLAQLAVVGICVGTGVCAGLFLRDKLKLFHQRF